MYVKIGTRVLENSSKISVKVKDKPVRTKKPIIHVDSFQQEEQLGVVNWSSPRNPFQTKSKQPKTLVQVFISIAGALLIGTVMGFSVLSLFFSNSIHSTNSIDDHLPAPIVKTPQHPKHADTSVKTSVVSLPTLHVLLLQAGNYHLKSSATKVADQYRTDGFAAVMSNRPPYRIFLGVAGSKADAHLLAKRYTNKGISVYVKELSLSTTGKNVANYISVLQKGNSLFTQLQGLSLKVIKNPGKLNVSTETLLKEQYAFMQASKLPTSYPVEVRVAMLELSRGLDQAVQGLNEYAKHPNATLAWFIQEGLVRYATGYEQLSYTISQNQ